MHFVSLFPVNFGIFILPIGGEGKHNKKNKQANVKQLFHSSRIYYYLLTDLTPNSERLCEHLGDLCGRAKQSPNLRIASSHPLPALALAMTSNCWFCVTSVINYYSGFLKLHSISIMYHIIAIAFSWLLCYRTAFPHRPYNLLSSSPIAMHVGFLKAFQNVW